MLKFSFVLLQRMNEPGLKPFNKNCCCIPYLTCHILYMSPYLAKIYITRNGNAPPSSLGKVVDRSRLGIAQ